ncbi:DUF4345 domain-containing protein [Mycolicibacter kumamotonensis]|jgi:hypothetical protein|uniref:DUF4345 domain-containing protein n=1 Tax=Mycolicibacter kumamotonensis TaxID=354243 RepID=A0A1B8SCJ1_9MYCO|nr:DUF4345 domain-containing protein [Mycolicibacter kumamotonensis]OBY30453.1 membrane protein [Mycolicibacter kumamotonensis]ORA76113.1 DUF4345 domain-containing protein [Mycolicibacter kumamotonensis]
MAVFAIAFIAVFFLAMGLYALAAPTALAQPLGITLTSSTSRSEVRAVYGGFGVAMAGILGFAAVNPEYRAGITLTAAAALAGMAFGRLLSAVIERRRTPFYPNWFYCLVEVGAALLLFSSR